MKYFINYILAISTALILFSCGGNPTSEDNKGNELTQTPDSVQNQSKPASPVQEDDTILIKALSKEILTSLKNKDFETFADYFNPVEGVRFSPYAYIDTINNIRLNAENFKEGIKTNKKFTWGYSDGSGDPIQLTIPDYFKKFVYNKDFLNVEKSSVDKMIGSGNSLNNLEVIYPHAHFTESFDPGSHEMAWSVLRLVFKKESGKFYLVGVVHDQWTI